MQTDQLPDLKAELKKYFGFNKFKGQQESIIASLLGGSDAFVIMPTGGGKSLCYQLPALISDGTAIVVSPLIALMKNQVDAIRGFSQDDSVAHVLNSSLTKRETNQVKSDVIEGKTKLLYVAPESLTKEDNIQFLREAEISFYAIDEAHCISEWGHDFRPEYRNLRNIMSKIGDAPIIALTATATPKVQEDIQKNLGMDSARVYKDSFNRPNLYYEVRPKKDVVRQIIKYVKANAGKSGIIYCLSRKKVEELAQQLQVNGIKALPYHAGLDASTRAKHQDAFLMEDVDVIVATIAFGMGIDKPDVRFVIHHDIPKSLESYYQETGRAGRDGGEGNCIAFYSYKDIEKLEKFMSNKPVNEREVGQQLLQEVVAYAETSMSRRKFILHYFGEEWNEVDGDGVGMDDNQRHPKDQFEGKNEVLLALKAVEESREKFRMQDLIKLLVGKENSLLKANKADRLEAFGSGNEHDETFWQMLFRQIIVNNLLKKEIETYGTLKLTEKGVEFLQNPSSFMLAEDHEYDDSDDGTEDVVTQKSTGGGADEVLLKMLKDLNKKVASQKGLPPYAIFPEASLQDMAIHYPITTQEMKNIHGVGEGKALKFGKPFADLISKYVEENNIDRPEDFVVKSVVNKSSLKVFIITKTDSKIPLEEIASAKSINMDELITEIEHIVHSGTKVDLDYYLDEALDEDEQDDILEYFKEDSETGDIQEAIEEFDGDYDEEILRLMKIKFLSQYAN
jgi:ATP-dependent DNA helicase RecQ